MFRRAGKYIVGKITTSLVGRAVKWVFWGVVLANPVTVVSTVGISGLAIGAATVHSGLIEYGTNKIINR